MSEAVNVQNFNQGRNLGLKCTTPMNGGGDDIDFNQYVSITDEVSRLPKDIHKDSRQSNRDPQVELELLESDTNDGPSSEVLINEDYQTSLLKIPSVPNGSFFIYSNTPSFKKSASGSRDAQRASQSMSKKIEKLLGSDVVVKTKKHNPVFSQIIGGGIVQSFNQKLTHGAASKNGAMEKLLAKEYRLKKSQSIEDITKAFDDYRYHGRRRIVTSKV